MTLLPGNVEPSYKTELSIAQDSQIQIQEPTSLNLTQNLSLNPIEQNIHSFLKYLVHQHELDIYYLLFNEVEVISFNPYKIEISAPKISLNQKVRISELLFEWTGEKWDVMITPQELITSLKEQLVAKLDKSSEWQMIKNSFPHASLIDVYIKENS